MKRCWIIDIRSCSVVYEGVKRAKLSTLFRLILSLLRLFLLQNQQDHNSPKLWTGNDTHWLQGGTITIKVTFLELFRKKGWASRTFLVSLSFTLSVHLITFTPKKLKLKFHKPCLSQQRTWRWSNHIVFCSESPYYQVYQPVHWQAKTIK